jgi:hypothetical protein
LLQYIYRSLINTLLAFFEGKVHSNYNAKKAREAGSIIELQQNNLLLKFSVALQVYIEFLPNRSMFDAIDFQDHLLNHMEFVPLVVDNQFLNVHKFQ